MNRSAESHCFGPILLLAFDKMHIEIDLAFPSKKGGALEDNGAVSFETKIAQDTEAFWAVRLLRVNIFAQAANTNLPIVVHFLSYAVRWLFACSDQDSNVIVYP